MTTQRKSGTGGSGHLSIYGRVFLFLVPGFASTIPTSWETLGTKVRFRA